MRQRSPYSIRTNRLTWPHRVNKAIEYQEEQQPQTQPQKSSAITETTKLPKTVNSNNNNEKMAEVEVEQIVEVTDEVSKDKEEDEVEDQPRRMLLPTGLDKESIREAYEDVRSDQTDTDWAVFKFQNCTITCTARGQGFAEFREQFGENDRAFGYIRIQMGDEMSKRQKFVFLTWIGQYVGVLPRAKMSTDKALIREVLSNFAVELYAGVDDELDIELFRGALERAGGANYGTGV